MYPFDFRPKGGFIDDKKIFVAMPFEDRFEIIYTDLIEPAIFALNENRNPNDKLFLYRAKDPRHTRTGWLNILENLFTSRVIIGVLTGDNPNVFYELGIVHATQQIERQILLAEKGYKIKFDLKDIIHCFYDPDDIEASKDDLSISINDTLKYYKLINDRLVSQAESKISRYELWVLNHFGSNSHFVIPELMSDRLFDAIAFLCHHGLLRLSTQPRVGGSIEFSYYWTDLGNAVLTKLNIVNEQERLDRSGKYWETFDV